MTPAKADEWVGFVGWDAKRVAKWIRDSAATLAADSNAQIENLSASWLHDLWNFANRYNGLYYVRFKAAKVPLASAYWGAKYGDRELLVSSLNKVAEILKDVR